MTPSPEEKNEDVFISLLAADTNRTVYTDLTRHFPVTSISGHKYVMVLCHYDSNGIILRTLKNRSNIEAMRVYHDIYEYIKARNCKPKLKIMDNEASTAVKRYITNANVNYQLVEPNNHRVHAAECAIRTFKNNVVAGLSSVHPKFPMYLWYELIPQAFITLNLLRTYRTCTKISVYAHLHGTYNFGTTPLSPLGVRVLLYNDSNHTVSYVVHGDEAYYLGPALEHYRCYKLLFPSTGGIKICATAQFFQQMSQHQCYFQLLKYQWQLMS